MSLLRVCGRVNPITRCCCNQQSGTSSCRPSDAGSDSLGLKRPLAPFCCPSGRGSAHRQGACADGMAELWIRGSGSQGGHFNLKALVRPRFAATQPASWEVPDPEHRDGRQRNLAPSAKLTVEVGLSVSEVGRGQMGKRVSGLISTERDPAKPRPGSYDATMV